MQLEIDIVSRVKVIFHWNNRTSPQDSPNQSRQGVSGRT